MDETDELRDLRERFNTLMHVTMQRCIDEIKYRPSYVLSHFAEHDGTDTAIWLVSLQHDSTGFTRLWEEGRLDLSAEALVLRAEYAPLFPVDLRRRAYDTLKEYSWKGLADIKRP